ncbi:MULTISPECIES: fimbrial protein [Citrobacter]|uniref:fimbrial protein n=1 Tax=Citrobacter TaxID=544 RepID=UPI00065063F6|nr:MULTISPECIES: fimbrial protein [Citrobacter]KLV67224.1 hypothetical protein SK36_01946 [Citrobacter sp. MGH106]
MTVKKYTLVFLLLMSSPSWSDVNRRTNTLTLKAEIVSGTCDITASDVDLGDLNINAFSAGGNWAGLSATSPGNVATKPLQVKARCDSGSAEKTLILSFQPQKAQLSGNQIFPNEYTGPTGRVKATSAAENIGVVVFYESTNVLNKDNTSAVNFTRYIGSESSYSEYTFQARYQIINPAKPVTPGGVLSQVKISVSYK